MSATWKYQAQNWNKIIDSNNENKAHFYMERLMLFPADIQDRIIEDISDLSHCNTDAVDTILGHYSKQALK
jgi:hypothetical protein